jgi:DNA-binding NarL/FixJ family response regulator
VRSEQTDYPSLVSDAVGVKDTVIEETTPILAGIAMGGAAGYLSKTASPRELEQAIRAAIRGGSQRDRSYAPHFPQKGPRFQFQRQTPK